MNDHNDNLNYCDMNHSGPDHEWREVQCGGEMQNPGTEDSRTICTHCGVEK
jgi:hypothetical protein